MDSETYDRLAKLIANPPPGSKLAAAKEQGVDLAVLLENLRLTPTERIEKMCFIANLLEPVQRVSRFPQLPQSTVEGRDRT